MLYNLPLKERVLGPIMAQVARTEGKRTYLRIQDKSYNFEEAYLVSRAVARGFRAQGLAKQESVALLLPNCAEFVFSWYACCLIGAVMVPANPAYTGYMLEYVLADSKAKGLVVTPFLLPALATVSDKVRQQLKWVAVVGGCKDIDPPAGPGAYLDFKDLQVTAGPDPEESVTYEDIQCIMYTSGTTGPSKGVVMPNGHFFASTCVFLRAVGLNRDDILFTPFPLFHGMASRLGVLPALMVGAEIVVAERFSSSKFWQQVCECQATFAHTLFTIPPILKGQTTSPYDRAHRLRGMYNAHYDPEFENRFGVRLFEAYGLTETGLVIATEFPLRREGSCGHVVEDWEAEIMDNNDFPLPPGEVGEIVLRPKLPSIMMKGYLNQPEATMEAFRNLWFHTGDFAKRDADGYFYFADRKKERIRRRGENIAAQDVETIILAHPDVIECAALPHPAPGGEDDIRVVLVVEKGSNLTPEGLMDWLKRRMSFFMMPRYLEFVDKLPKTPTEKIQKVELVEQGLSPNVWDREAVGYKIGRDDRPTDKDKRSA